VIRKQSKPGPRPSFSAKTEETVRTFNRSAQPNGESIVLHDAGGSGFDILGLPTKNIKQPYIWMIINDDPVLSLRIMPFSADYHVSCGFVRALMNKYNVNSDNPTPVMTLLQLTCLREPEAQ